MEKFSIINNSDTGLTLKNSGSANDVATFVAKFAQEQLFSFKLKMQEVFGDSVKVSAKTSVMRIATKIIEIMQERKCSAAEAWPFLTDILRLQIFCHSPAEVQEVFMRKILPCAYYF